MKTEMGFEEGIVAKEASALMPTNARYRRSTVARDSYRGTRRRRKCFHCYIIKGEDEI